jgi:repressor LexA
MSTPLTPRQTDVLDAIQKIHERQGFPPTLGEIATHVGIQSHSTVAHHLAHLRIKGFVTWERRKVRTIVLTERARAAA